MAGRIIPYIVHVRGPNDQIVSIDLSRLTDPTLKEEVAKNSIEAERGEFGKQPEAQQVQPQGVGTNVIHVRTDEGEIAPVNLDAISDSGMKQRLLAKAIMPNTLGIPEKARNIINRPSTYSVPPRDQLINGIKTGSEPSEVQVSMGAPEVLGTGESDKDEDFTQAPQKMAFGDEAVDQNQPDAGTQVQPEQAAPSLTDELSNAVELGIRKVAGDKPVDATNAALRRVPEIAKSVGRAALKELNPVALPPSSPQDESATPLDTSARAIPTPGPGTQPPATKSEGAPYNPYNKVVNQSLSDISSAGKETQQAIKDHAAALDEVNKATHELRQNEIARQQEAVANMSKLNQAHQEEMQRQTDKLQKLMTDYSNQSVDPERYWANRTTGGKMMAGIGLALGALGAGPTGINRAVSVIDNAIKNDIQAQRDNLEKTGKVISGQASLLNITRQNYDSDMAQNAAAEAVMHQVALNKIELAASQATTNEQKAALAQLAAQEKAKIAEAQGKIGIEAKTETDKNALGWAKLNLVKNQKEQTSLISASFNDLMDLTKQFMKASQGPLPNIAGKVSQMVPGSDWDRYQQLREAFKRPIVNALFKQGRARTEADAEKMADSMVPDVGMNKTRGMEKFKALQKTIERELSNPISPQQMRLQELLSNED